MHCVLLWFFSVKLVLKIHDIAACLNAKWLVSLRILTYITKLKLTASETWVEWRMPIWEIPGLINKKTFFQLTLSFNFHFSSSLFLCLWPVSLSFILALSHTHTHTLSLSLSLSLFSLIHVHYLYLSLSLCFTISLSYIFVSLSLSLSFSLFHATIHFAFQLFLLRIKAIVGIITMERFIHIEWKENWFGMIIFYQMTLLYNLEKTLSPHRTLPIKNDAVYRVKTLFHCLNVFYMFYLLFHRILCLYPNIFSILNKLIYID